MEMTNISLIAISKSIASAFWTDSVHNTYLGWSGSR